MFSPEFMRFLINYQKPEYDSNIYKQVKQFKFKSGGNRLAAEFLSVKK